MRLIFLSLSIFIGTLACKSTESGKDSSSKSIQRDLRGLNTSVGTQILYELQVRTINACRTDVGSSEQRTACAQKASSKQAPLVEYKAENMSCSMFSSELKPIQLGTLDDLMANTNDYKKGITLNYIKELGATTIWIMPPFPNNDRWNIPDGCDNLGSPYAVRDYLHIQGALDSKCNKMGADENSSTPCWGNNKFKALIDQAHAKGLKVWLDLAFNHFGHNYMMYDYENFKSVHERLKENENLNDLWNFDKTFDASLIRPNILDSEAALTKLIASEPHKSIYQAFAARCSNNLPKGQNLVRAYGAWRNALQHERDQFDCKENFLESQVPGFYMGQNGSPSKRAGDNLTNNWLDVKFLYHKEQDPSQQHTFVRNREYLFRIMNYYASLGVDGFRLDHTTESGSGLDANEWRYLLNKVDFYAWKRDRKKLAYMAEEFSSQMAMSPVIDVMTDGYVGDMLGRNIPKKGASHVEKVISNMDRFNGKSYVMTALETHDEHRLLDKTGLNIWTGAGFWGIGLTTWSVPMLLGGQELGEPWGLGFKRSDFIRSRFEGSSNFNPSGPELRDFYARMIWARTKNENRALYSSNRHFLRTKDGNKVDERIFAQMKWSEDLNVIFTFHNLWEEDAEQSYFIPPNVASAAGIRDDKNYVLRNILANDSPRVGDCKLGKDLKWNFYVKMPKSERAQWLRLEECN